MLIRRSFSALITAALTLSSFSASAKDLVAETPFKKPSLDCGDRPCQFVMLAFDGSKELAFWEESRKFTLDQRKAGIDARFTYFISGVYFLHPGNKQRYDTPRLGKGRSAIRFSTKFEDISPRIDQVNAAYEEGHEIASHGNGHYDGGGKDSNDPMFGMAWDKKDWTSEFEQFTDFIFNVFKNNGIRPSEKYPQGWLFGPANIVGYRAPKLGVSDDLWPVLEEQKFRYDTSKVAMPNYWPKKNSYGTWNFPLAELKISETGRKTLSMDFNFYAQQTRGVETMWKADPDNVKKTTKRQMYNTYMDYFQKNYFGNRAPINIGHHFSRWNGGAYWEAMQEFTKTVCDLPEVRCVTYTEYMGWLESLPAAKLAQYRDKKFPALAKSKIKLQEVAGPVMNADVKMALKGDSFVAVSAQSSREDAIRGFKTKMYVNGRILDQSSITREELSKMIPAGSTAQIGASLVNKKGIEVNSSTHTVNQFNTPYETISTSTIEDRALMGDLPEAHNELGE